MSTTSQNPTGPAPERRGVPPGFVWREMWAALAVGVIWLAVLFAAVFGSDIVADNAGTDVTTVPSGVVVAAFASLATWVIAKYGFGRGGRDAG